MICGPGGSGKTLGCRHALGKCNVVGIDVDPFDMRTKSAFRTNVEERFMWQNVVDGKQPMAVVIDDLEIMADNDQGGIQELQSYIRRKPPWPMPVVLICNPENFKKFPDLAKLCKGVVRFKGYSENSMRSIASKIPLPRFVNPYHVRRLVTDSRGDARALTVSLRFVSIDPSRLDQYRDLKAQITERTFRLLSEPKKKISEATSTFDSDLYAMALCLFENYLSWVPSGTGMEVEASAFSDADMFAARVFDSGEDMFGFATCIIAARLGGYRGSKTEDAVRPSVYWNRTAAVITNGRSWKELRGRCISKRKLDVSEDTLRGIAQIGSMVTDAERHSLMEAYGLVTMWKKLKSLHNLKIVTSEGRGRAWRRQT